MASLITNGVFSSFSSQPFSENTKISKGSSSKSDFCYKTTKSKPHKYKFLKLRASQSERVREANSSHLSSTDDDTLQKFLKRDNKWGFSKDIDSFTIRKGLSEEIVRLIWSINNEPDWMLEFRLKGYHQSRKMPQPKWSDNVFPEIDLQNICYYSAPKVKPTLNSVDEANPELVKYYEELGIPLGEKDPLVAKDTVFDSASIATTNSKILEEQSGVIFCSMSEAIKKYPDLVRKYLGKVVSYADNYYAALNAAVFTAGSFVYIPKDTKCPMKILTDFRINAKETGQFERTLIVADDRSFVEYFEGCTSPSYDKSQLHAAVVELYCNEEAEIKYSTIQNWDTGDENGKGGIYNFVTKRGLCAGRRSKISWTQVETGSAITWKYPSVVLKGDDSVGEFYSVASTNNLQQADTGTKMIHKGNNTKSVINSKSISAGKSRTTYRGLVQVQSRADNARNSSQCDSMLIGDMSAANTYPDIQVKGSSARIEHEASTSKIGEEELFYFQQRGIDNERARDAIVFGYCGDILENLPDEIGAEAKALLSLRLTKSVG